MCTMPSSDRPPPGGSKLTKTPKSWTLVTVPVIHSWSEIPSKAERSLKALLGFALLSTMASSSVPSFRTLLTQTSTSWPTRTTSSTLATSSSANLEMGTRPSRSAPTSTKAPYSARRTTRPRSFCWARRSPTGKPPCCFTLLIFSGPQRNSPSNSSQRKVYVPSPLYSMTIARNQPPSPSSSPSQNARTTSPAVKVATSLAGGA
mmetsp:Transcript_97647/g.217921  ORF Transcript_97647/g.217921 Transcript_97647/m.217921 type:complete len:204 (-) Transcript_97647:226-837(-)